MNKLACDMMAQMFLLSAVGWCLMVEESVDCVINEKALCVCVCGAGVTQRRYITWIPVKAGVLLDVGGLLALTGL